MKADKQGPILTLAHSLKRFASPPSKTPLQSKKQPNIN